MRNASTAFLMNGVSTGARSFIARRLAELCGLALIASVVLVGLALATWSTSDPSYNHATSGAIRNILGTHGAILADLLTQFFGLAALALIAPVAYWGWRLLVDRSLDRLKWRIIFWILGIICVAGLASKAPITDGWPLPGGLGGMIGDAVASIPRRLHFQSRVTGLVMTVLLAAGALLSLAASCSRKAIDQSGAASPSAPPKSAKKIRNRPIVSEPEAERPAPRPDKTTTNEARHSRVRSDDFPGDVRSADTGGVPGAAIVSIGAILHAGLAVKSAGKRKWAELAAVIENARRTREDAPKTGQRSDARRERIEPALDMPAHPPQSDPVRTDAPEPVLPHTYDRKSDDDSRQEMHHFPGEAEDGPEEPFHPLPSVDNPAVQTVAGHPGPQRKPDVQSAPVTVAKVTPAAAPLKQSTNAAVQTPSDGDGDAHYEHPPLALLSQAKPGTGRRVSEDALLQNARLLEGVLDDFSVKGEIINVRPGPVVTLYELEPAPGIKSSRVIGLADDIARSMSAISARVAVVQGRNAIGVELPNADRETVYLRELLASSDFETSKHRLAIALGKTIGGEPVIVDLARMPHLLVAGTTGSGKSVAINTMILSLLYRLRPEQCRLIMVDPKMLELSVYDGIPHLLTPVVTDPKKAVVALKWAVREMEDRYKKMSKLGVRNIDGFNARVSEADAEGRTITRTVQTGFNRETGDAIYEEEQMELAPLPYIVVIVDEMADLMMVAGKDIEGAIQRLAQMARAAGIHLIMATQRPSVDVITGTIKANFPTRISFQVTSKIDSRTILGEQGAEQLLGQGDMLYMAGGGRISRVHGPFVSDNEVEHVVAHLKLQGAPEYLESITSDEDEENGDSGAAGSESGGEESTDLYDRAVAIVLRDRKCSTSYVQRRLSVGYNKAASLVERMEKEGVVGQANHAGKREILVGSPERDAMGRLALSED